MTVAEAVSLRTWYEILCHRIPRMHFHASLREGHTCPHTSGWCQDGALDRGTGLSAPRDPCQPDPAGSGRGELLHPLLPPPTRTPILPSAHSTQGPQSQPQLCGRPASPAPPHRDRLGLAAVGPLGLCDVWLRATSRLRPEDTQRTACFYGHMTCLTCSQWQKQRLCFLVNFKGRNNF